MKQLFCSLFLLGILRIFHDAEVEKVFLLSGGDSKIHMFREVCALFFPKKLIKVCCMCNIEHHHLLVLCVHLRTSDIFLK